MLSKASVKIFKAMFDALPEGIHLREVSRKAGVSSETAHRILHQLSADDLMYFEFRGKEKVFHLQLANPVLPKYYELIKGKEAKDLVKNNQPLVTVAEKIVDDVKKRTEKKFSILLLSTSPVKLILLLGNDDYQNFIDYSRTVEREFLRGFPSSSFVLMSEDSLKNNLDQYPNMRDVIKRTSPMHGSEYYFKVLFEYWRDKNESARREGTGKDEGSVPENKSGTA